MLVLIPSYSFWLSKSSFPASNKSSHFPRRNYAHLWFTVFVKLCFLVAELIRKSKIGIQRINICIWSYYWLGRIFQLHQFVLIRSKDSKLLSEFEHIASELCLTVPSYSGFAKERLEGQTNFPTIGRSISQKPSSESDAHSSESDAQVAEFNTSEGSGTSWLWRRDTWRYLLPDFVAV